MHGQGTGRVTNHNLLLHTKMNNGVTARWAKLRPKLIRAKLRANLRATRHDKGRAKGQAEGQAKGRAAC